MFPQLILVVGVVGRQTLHKRARPRAQLFILPQHLGLARQPVLESAAQLRAILFADRGVAVGGKQQRCGGDAEQLGGVEEWEGAVEMPSSWGEWRSGKGGRDAEQLGGVEEWEGGFVIGRGAKKRQLLLLCEIKTKNGF